MMRLALRWRAAVLWGASWLALGATGLAGAQPASSDGPVPLVARTVEPRAFGYRTGDVVQRQVLIDVPSRLVLDESSLPTVGPQGPVLELRAIERQTQLTATGRQLRLTLRYQIFAAPVAVRTYELPALKLRFAGQPRDEDLRIDPWPVVVAALAMEEPSPRTGLGELRPDTAPPLRDTGFERAVLWACGAGGLLLLAYLGWVYFGLPWWGRRQRPFAQAWRLVQGHEPNQWALSMRALHGAFDRTAGRTVLSPGLDDFLARAPHFAPLRKDIATFFAASEQAFFAVDADRPAPAPPAPLHEKGWLERFAQACRNTERGTP